ncbi:hypothetical protein LMORI2_00210 [Limnohabitans sp. MORI2]|uniref:hypothetical protein n=1 Tax=Limnohabitans sp. MORI2 TaxID=1751150 RepID=UPI0023774D20|nr:hypothetical protein [Limnohabitans sp. MORI2]BDU57039.1 hypothetical protein LMORI2_00210 [Limnohabitans sp. MORI2]
MTANYVDAAGNAATDTAPNDSAKLSDVSVSITNGKAFSTVFGPGTAVDTVDATTHATNTAGGGGTVNTDFWRAEVINYSGSNTANREAYVEYGASFAQNGVTGTAYRINIVNIQGPVSGDPTKNYNQNAPIRFTSKVGTFTTMSFNWTDLQNTSKTITFFDANNSQISSTSISANGGTFNSGTLSRPASYFEISGGTLDLWNIDNVTVNGSSVPTTIVSTLASGDSVVSTTPTLEGTLTRALTTGETVHIFQDGVDKGVATVTGTNWTFGANLATGTASNFVAKVVNSTNVVEFESPSFALKQSANGVDAPVTVSITSATATTASSTTDSFTTSTTSADVNSLSTAFWDVTTSTGALARWVSSSSAPTNWVITGSELQIGVLSGNGSTNSSYNFAVKGGASFTGLSFVTGWGDVMRAASSPVVVTYLDANNNVVATDSFRFDQVTSKGSTYTYDSTTRNISFSGQATKFKVTMRDDNGFAIDDLTFKTSADSTPYSVGSGGTVLDTTPDLNGSISRALKSGETVEILRGSTSLGNANISVGSTAWSFTDTTGSVGSYTYTARFKSSTGGVLASSVFNLNIATTPLVLDLNGDGVQTTSISEGTQFDLLASGQKQHVGWVSKQDGLLAIDLNGDGQINSGAELFGDHAQLADGSLAKDGWSALRALDSNHDGKIDAQDAKFNLLRLWEDADGDGVTDAGELYSLLVKSSVEVHSNVAPVALNFSSDVAMDYNHSAIQADLAAGINSKAPAVLSFADEGFEEFAAMPVVAQPAVARSATELAIDQIGMGATDVEQATSTSTKVELKVASPDTLTMDSVTAETAKTDLPVSHDEQACALAVVVDPNQQLIDQTTLNSHHAS